MIAMVSFVDVYLKGLENTKDWKPHNLEREMALILQGEPQAAAGSPSERTDHWVVAANNQEAEQLIKERHPGQEVTSIEQVPDLHGAYRSGCDKAEVRVSNGTDLSS